MKRYLLALPIILLAIASVPSTALAATMSNLFGYRYCEVIIMEDSLTLAVYNTIGLNNCPENLWQALTASKIKQQTGAMYVKLNGPRFWLMNEMIHSNLATPQIQAFGGIAMRKAATIHLTFAETMHGESPYHQHRVKRHTVWIYHQGTRIYELIDKNGRIFVMQSYSIQKEPQTVASLQQLGSKLKLPNGWTFKSGVLTTTQQLPAVNNEAHVLQDNLLNTYQLSAQDLLSS